MISHSESSRSVGSRVVRYLLVTIGIAIYVLLASIASINVRQTTFDGFSEVASFVVRHVILIPGLAPLIVFIAWCLGATRGRTIAEGFLVVPAVVIFHFFVAVVSGHSDGAYVTMQALEFLITGSLLRYLWRTMRRTSDQS